MKAKLLKWLNLIALVLLYAISAIVACLLISIFSEYISEIAENIRFYTYIGVGAVALGLLFFRRVKTPPTKIAKFEWVIAIFLAIMALLVLGGGLVSAIVKHDFNPEKAEKYLGWCYLFFAVIAPVTLMLLSTFVCAEKLLAIATGAFSFYSFAIIIISTLGYIGFLSYFTEFLEVVQATMSLLLTSIPLIFFCVVMFMSLRLIKSAAKPTDVARFQNKRSLWGLIFTIVFALITVLIVSINDLYSIGIFTSMLSFILFALIPSALYFVVMKIACFKYRKEEGENL